ncbi:MAG: TPM domain-containing protein [Eubacteriales bacterium]|nr:TPM domain-containing protein [Eubacteriales bacterium]
MMKAFNGLKRLTALISMTLLLVLILFTSAYAKDDIIEQETKKKYDAIVYDNADLLTDEHEAILLEEMEPLTEYGNMIFVTIELDKGEDYEGIAEQVYYSLYGDEPGALFQIDMGNRKITLSCSTEMEKLLGKERDSIVDNIYKQATAGNYYKCASMCFSQIYTILNDGKIAHTMKYINNGILALILALMLNFIILFTESRPAKPSVKMLGGAAKAAAVIGAAAILGQRTTKTYSPQSSGGGGGGHSGGGGFSGGGGGGGFSGGSSSHGF